MKNLKKIIVAGFRSGLFRTVNLTLFLIIKVDEERHKYKCYITDGDMTQNIDINVAVIQFPDIENIINQYNLEI